MTSFVTAPTVSESEPNVLENLDTSLPANEELDTVSGTSSGTSRTSDSEVAGGRDESGDRQEVTSSITREECQSSG